MFFRSKLAFYISFLFLTLVVVLLTIICVFPIVTRLCILAVQIELPALLCDMVYSLSLHDIGRFRDGPLFILGIFFVAGCFSLFCFSSFSFHLRAVGMEWRVFSLRFDIPQIATSMRKNSKF